MANSIVLKTFRGGNVTPQDDAIIYQTIIPGAGVFKGCEVTCARGNILHISQGFGMIKGRFFEVYENEVSVQLADTGTTLRGRIYIHMDLSNADEPIQILTTTAEMLPSLDADSNINYNNTSYDLELATFNVDSTSIMNLVQTFSTLQAGGGSGGSGGGMSLMRETAYVEGNTVSASSAPAWCTFVCTQAGTTAIIEPNGYSQITKVGDRVLDGSCIFTARSTYGELDEIMAELNETKTNLADLDSRFEASQSDIDTLVMKLLSLDEYRNLESYDSSTMYYCYEDESTREITSIYLGEKTIFATGIQVKYHIDSDYLLVQTASLSSDVIASAPTASLDGYIFVGWRADNNPNKEVLDKKIIDSDAPLDIYAVFKRDIEIDMMDNGATLIEGKTESHFNDVLYYNNGNANSEGIIIPECPYEIDGMTFCGWNIDCFSDPTYKPGEKGTFPDDSILFPMFVDTEYDFPYTGSYMPFTIPADGIYEFELYGAAGKEATGTVNSEIITAPGGKGGHVKAYKKMKKGELIYIFNGGKPTTSNNAGVNGGGPGYSYSGSGTSRSGGAAGGGATHITKYGGTLGSTITNSATASQSLDYLRRDNILLVAGGGGGGGVGGADNNTVGINRVTSGAHPGGDGGGERGGDGSNSLSLGGRQVSTGSTDSFNFGKAQAQSSGSGSTYSGGGGGWFGGMVGYNGNSGAGGSGYVGGMPTFTHDKVLYRAINEAGKNDGDGYSFIRYIKCV